MLPEIRESLFGKNENRRVSDSETARYRKVTNATDHLADTPRLQFYS